jgi:phosphodiesterase/alkaline phosphatase D-like protein
MNFKKRTCLSVVAALYLSVIGRDGSAAPESSSDVVWVWSGAVTTNSAVVKARLEPTVRQARLRVSSIAEPESVIAVPANGFSQADSDGVVTFPVSGLKPGTEYRYVVETNGGLGLEGRFQTFVDGPMSFRLGFASCATTGSNHPIFDTLRNLNPLLFIHMGDFHYEDIKQNDPSLFRRAYDRVLTSPRQGAFYRSTPIAYVWDDHDFGPNDADGTSPSKPAALKTYQQCVPHYPLSPVNGEVKTIQQAFTIGRVRFLITDSRAERVPEDQEDGPEKTMLGKDQLEWLRRELKATRGRYPLVVWVNGVPWITKNEPGSDHGWEPYSHERTLIADMIKEFGLVDHLLMLSGDGHMVAIDDGTNSNYASDRASNERAFPVIHAAPLHRYPRVKGGPYSHGVYAPKRWFPLIQAKQFGLMDLEDDGRRIRIELSCRDAEGDVLKNLILRMECVEDGCKVIV